MNLVMIMQSVDEADSVFGAHIPWIVHIAREVDRLFVIGLSVGVFSAPSNVKVFSMGKEKGYGKLRRAIRLEKILLSVYTKWGIDGIFVHQGQIYGPLLAPFRIIGVPVILFKAHGSLPSNIRLLLPFFDKVATTTQDTFPLETPKKISVGQGIDLEKFRCDQLDLRWRPGDQPLRIVASGRITPIKGYEVLIEAASFLIDKGYSNIIFEIYGEPYKKSDVKYEQRLRVLVKEKGLEDRVIFKGAVPHSELPGILCQSFLYIDSSIGPSALNKGMLEAMACGLPVFTANEKFASLFGPYSSKLQYRLGNAEHLANLLEAYLELSDNDQREIRKRMRQAVECGHDVKRLAKTVVGLFEDLGRSNPRRFCNLLQ